MVVTGCGMAASGNDTGRDEADTRDPSSAVPAGPWLGSFESGLDADEQLWLLSASGEPVSVMNPSVPARDVGSRSSLGYLDGSGQISETLFDVAHERVLVTSAEDSNRVTRALDLRTWAWSTLPPSALRSTQRGPVLLSLEDTLLTVLTFSARGELETVASVGFPIPEPLSSVDVQRQVIRGQERLILVTGGNVLPIVSRGEFVRQEGEWVPTRSAAPSLVDTAYFEASGSADRACVVGVDGSGWILEGGSLSAQVELPFAVQHCAFSPDGSRIAFSERRAAGQLRVTNLVGRALADFERLYLQASHGDFSYGTAPQGFVRLDWSSLELETLPWPDWCRGDAGESNVGGLGISMVGAAALVEMSCRTIDSHFSGVFLLPLEDGAVPQTLLEPQGWDILQIAPLADGSALIAQLPAGGEYLPDAGDRFMRVGPDGSVRELGPFSEMPVPLHAPVGNVRP